MLGQGRELYEGKIKMDAEREEGRLGIFGYWKGQRASNKTQHEFEANCMLIEKDFEQLNMIAQYKHKVEPCRYTFNFLFGLIGLVVSMILFVQMWVAGTLRFEDRQHSPWLSTELDNMLRSPNWSFMSIIIFCFFATYLFYATLLGNIKFGLRFFSLSFYPLVPHETFVNSFIINAFLMNLWMHALTFELIDLFRQFFAGT